jgi:hypothetical protein
MFSVIVKLTGEFASLEEHTNDLDIAIVAVFLADGSDLVGSDRRIESKEPTQKFRLLIVRSIS